MTGYNNFYEFGTDKTDPARYAGSLRTRPGTVQVDGLVKRPGTWDIDALLKLAPPEERVYRLRRMIGLYAFFYATFHFFSYVWLDQFFDWPEIVKDIAKRPFITVGVADCLLLIPLVTFSDRMIRRLGKRWRQLHRLV